MGWPLGWYKVPSAIEYPAARRLWRGEVPEIAGLGCSIDTTTAAGLVEAASRPLMGLLLPLVEILRNI